MSSSAEASPSVLDEPQTTQDSIASTPNAALNELLSYPAPSELSVPLASSSSSARPRTILKDRLYVGNLHPTVDECVFSTVREQRPADYDGHKIHPPTTLLEIRQDCQARFSLPQIRPTQRETQRLCLCRVRQQRRTFASLLSQRRALTPGFFLHDIVPTHTTACTSGFGIK